MTEVRDFKDFLKSVFKSYLLKEATDYIDTLKESRIDPKTKAYRSPDENEEIKENLRTKVEELADDFIDELEAKNLSTPEDYENNVKALARIIDNYIAKYMKWLQQQ